MFQRLKILNNKSILLLLFLSIILVKKKKIHFLIYDPNQNMYDGDSAFQLFLKLNVKQFLLFFIKPQC